MALEQILWEAALGLLPFLATIGLFLWFFKGEL